VVFDIILKRIVLISIEYTNIVVRYVLIYAENARKSYYNIPSTEILGYTGVSKFFACSMNPVPLEGLSSNLFT
jgi:hypothetical protein